MNLGAVSASTIVDYGVSLTITGEPIVDKIDASNAPLLVMEEPALAVNGVIILAGTGSGNILQGSVNLFSGLVTTVTFSNGSQGFSAPANPDHLTGGSTGNDAIGGSSDD